MSTKDILDHEINVETASNDAATAWDSTAGLGNFNYYKEKCIKKVDEPWISKIKEVEDYFEQEKQRLERMEDLDFEDNDIKDKLEIWRDQDKDACDWVGGVEDYSHTGCHMFVSLNTQEQGEILSASDVKCTHPDGLRDHAVEGGERSMMLRCANGARDGNSENRCPKYRCELCDKKVKKARGMYNTLLYEQSKDKVGVAAYEKKPEESEEWYSESWSSYFLSSPWKCYAVLAAWFVPFTGYLCWQTDTVIDTLNKDNVRLANLANKKQKSIIGICSGAFLITAAAVARHCCKTKAVLERELESGEYAEDGVRSSSSGRKGIKTTDDGISMTIVVIICVVVLLVVVLALVAVIMVFFCSRESDDDDDDDEPEDDKILDALDRGAAVLGNGVPQVVVVNPQAQPPPFVAGIVEAVLEPVADMPDVLQDPDPVEQKEVAPYRAPVPQNHPLSRFKRMLKKNG